jgi:hypothetical protein
MYFPCNRWLFEDERITVYDFFWSNSMVFPNRAHSLGEQSYYVVFTMAGLDVEDKPAQRVNPR